MAKEKKFGYFRLPKAQDLKEKNKVIRVRIIDSGKKGKSTLRSIYKHKGFNEYLYGLDTRPESKDLACKLFNSENKTREENGRSLITNAMALAKFKETGLKFGSMCNSTSDIVKDRIDQCNWCKKQYEKDENDRRKGYFNLIKRRKHSVGFLVDENNIPMILNVDGNLAGNIFEDEKIDQKYLDSYWIELYADYKDVAGDNKLCLCVRQSKEEIEDVHKLDKEIFSEYNVDREYFIVDEDSDTTGFLMKYYDGVYIKKEVDPNDDGFSDDLDTDSSDKKDEKVDKDVKNPKKKKTVEEKEKEIMNMLNDDDLK